jgi:hypothetical protein
MLLLRVYFAHFAHKAVCTLYQATQIVWLSWQKLLQVWLWVCWCRECQRHIWPTSYLSTGS